MSEQDLVNTILEYLQFRGAVAIRINSGMRVIEDQNGSRRVFRGAPAGTSDILCCYKGRFVAIEVKLPGNRPTQKQQAFLDSVDAAGGTSFPAWDLSDVIFHLSTIDQVQELIDGRKSGL